MSSDFTVKTPSPNYRYPIKTPAGRIVTPSVNRSWSMPKENFNKLIKDNRIWFGNNGSAVPRLKTFLSEVQQGIRVYPH